MDALWAGQGDIGPASHFPLADAGVAQAVGRQDRAMDGAPVMAGGANAAGQDHRLVLRVVNDHHQRGQGAKPLHEDQFSPQGIGLKKLIQISGTSVEGRR